MKPECFFETRIGDALVVTLPMLSDNYTFIVLQGEKAIVVDPAEPEPVLQFLKSRNLALPVVLNTHHHADHIGGNGGLKSATRCRIMGPKDSRIDTLDFPVRDEEILQLGSLKFRVIVTPGHTRTHVAYYAPGMVFTGDTLFAAGCGRLLEGTAGEMWKSLRRLRDLPDNTLVFCGHEYTVENLRFAQQIEPDNLLIRARLEEAMRNEAQGRPNVPATIAIEKQTNPFLRADSESMKAVLDMKKARNEDVFAELRRRKDL